MTTQAVAIDVGFIGAGGMGGPMVHRLLGAGARVTVHARRVEAAKAFAGAGATITDRISDAVTGKSVVIVCLFDERQLEDVVLGTEGVAAQLDPRSTLVIHTTSGPQMMRDIAEVAATRQSSVLDAPISGSSLDITEGRLTVLAGGAPEVVADMESVLSAYAARYFPTGELGSASTVKLINNLLFTANVQLVAEAAAMGTALGIEPSALMAAIGQCSGASDAMRRVAMAPSVAEFGAGVGKYLSKDATAALALADTLGSPSPLFRHVTAQGPLDLGVTSVPRRGDRSS